MVYLEKSLSFPLLKIKTMGILTGGAGVGAENLDSVCLL